MINRPVLYSTNTWLAYKISQLYFGDEHYIWCTPFFDQHTIPANDYALPPSSSPSEIYYGLENDVKRGDRHSAKIAVNKSGILKGAHYMKASQDITDRQLEEIVSILDQAQISDFRPLLYVIPSCLVKSLVEEVPIEERAHPLSEEYIITSLPRKMFDIIRLNGI